MMNQPQPMSTSVSVFYSYAHKDEALRKELENHLSSLRRQGHISEWHDRQIGAGMEWASQIDEHLETASIILLLISSDFLASDYCYGIEMQRAMKRHEAKEARVIPIILRPVYWKDEPFATLQALPTDGKPVTDDKYWSTPDHAFSDVAKGIRQVVHELRMLDEARSYVTSFRYEEALEGYDKLLQMYPHSAAAYAGKGDALSHLKRYREAVNAYDQAHKLDPTISVSENEYGSALLAVKRYEEALSAFDRAIEIDSDLASAYSGKGDVLFQLHRYQDALTAYDKALHLNTSDANLYVSKGYALEQLAQQAFRKAKQIDHNGEMHMEHVDHFRKQIQSPPIKIERLALHQTITIPNSDFQGSKTYSNFGAIATSPDGKYLAGDLSLLQIREGDKFGIEIMAYRATLWDLKTGNVIKTIGDFRNHLSCLHFSSDGQTLLSSWCGIGQSDGQRVTQTWDVRTGELIRVFPSPPSPYGVISSDEQLFVGDMRNEQREQTWINGEDYDYPPGSRLKLCVVNLNTGRLLIEFPLDQGGWLSRKITVLAVSSNGKMIIEGSQIFSSEHFYLAILSLWDTFTGRLLHTISDMPTRLTALTIAPDGQIFASGYANGTIKLWDVSTTQLLSAFAGHDGPIEALTFSTDGHQLISGGHDLKIKVWRDE